MDYVKPADVAAAMVETGSRKLALAPFDLMIRGLLAGAILGVATSLAFTGAAIRVWHDETDRSARQMFAFSLLYLFLIFSLLLVGHLGGGTR